MSDPLPPLPSELTGTYFARTLGLLWNRFQRSPMKEGDYRALWEGARTVSLLSTIATDGKIGCHSSRCCTNELSRVAGFVQTHIGIKPFEEWYGK